MDRIQAIESNATAKWNALKEHLKAGESPVASFYDNAVVFMTGGSGFLGKQLIEKLLRTCNIKRIYILLRQKKGQKIDKRLATMLEDPVYDLLRSEQPEFADKLVPIDGDVSELNLGINLNTWSILSKEVNVIFHVAATINFGVTVKLATLTNVRGTREMLTLARACEQLKSVVYVSTAYSYATRTRIRKSVVESFYKSPLPPTALIELAENMEADELDLMVKPLMSDWPNNYILTKSVAEELVKTMAVNLPICIVRPATVITAHREPEPGWIDISNVYGPSGLVLGMELCVIHTVLVNPDVCLDVVPVDFVNNTIIVAAWDTFTRYSVGYKQTTIYTVTSNKNSAKSDDIAVVLDQDTRLIASPKTLWYGFVYQTHRKWLYLFLTLILHYIPAYIIDGCCLLVGKSPRFVKVYKKVNTISSVFEYFITNEWIFTNENTTQLYEKLSDVDKQLYNFDINSVNMRELLFIWTYGLRKFIIRDGLKDTEYAIRKQFWLKIVHYIVFPLYLYALFKISSFLLVSLYFILTFLFKFVLEFKQFYI